VGKPPTGPPFQIGRAGIDWKGVPDPELEKTIARLEKRFESLQNLCDQQLPLGGKERWDTCAKEHAIVVQASGATPGDLLLAGRLAALRTKLAALKTRYAGFVWPVAPELRKKLQLEYMTRLKKK
jgi:hypothetical protein